MNVRLLRRIQKQILKEPRQFNMSYWFQFDSNGIPNCGTTACIAGWALAIHQKQKPLEVARSFRAIKDFGSEDFQLALGEITSAIYRRGQAALGITHSQAERLFVPICWPIQFRQVSVESAVKRIDHFISTNGKE